MANQSKYNSIKRYRSHQSKDKEQQLKVAGGSSAPSIAGAMAKFIEEGAKISLIAMGAGAVNQAVKAIAIARGMTSPQGYDLSCVPAFQDQNVDGVKKTAIVFYIRDGR